jgi:hypothetical protein
MTRHSGSGNGQTVRQAFQPDTQRLHFSQKSAQPLSKQFTTIWKPCSPPQLVAKAAPVNDLRCFACRPTFILSPPIVFRAIRHEANHRLHNDLANPRAAGQEQNSKNLERQRAFVRMVCHAGNKTVLSSR